MHNIKSNEMNKFNRNTTWNQSWYSSVHNRSELCWLVTCSLFLDWKKGRSRVTNRCLLEKTLWFRLWVVLEGSMCLLVVRFMRGRGGGTTLCDIRRNGDGGGAPYWPKDDLRLLGGDSWSRELIVVFRADTILQLVWFAWNAAIGVNGFCHCSRKFNSFFCLLSNSCKVRHSVKYECCIACGDIDSHTYIVPVRTKKKEGPAWRESW